MVGENTWINVNPHFSTNLLTEIFIGISIIYFTYIHISPKIHMDGYKSLRWLWNAENLLENAKLRLKYIAQHLSSYPIYQPIHVHWLTLIKSQLSWFFFVVEKQYQFQLHFDFRRSKLRLICSNVGQWGFR